MFDVLESSFAELDKVVKTASIFPADVNPFEAADEALGALKPWQVLAVGIALAWAVSLMWSLVDTILSKYS